jgi:hypothetical protein
MTTTKKTTTTEVKPKVSRRKAAPKATEQLPPNPFTFEVLNLAAKQRTKAKKIEVLRKYNHDSIKAILIWNFDESVISALPRGEVPYYDEEDKPLSDRIADAVEALNGGKSVGALDSKFTALRTEYTKLYNFIQGGNNRINTIRRENIFIDLLKGLHPLEAEMICLCKDKLLTTRYDITKDIVSEAFPDITWGGRS